MGGKRTHDVWHNHRKEVGFHRGMPLIPAVFDFWSSLAQLAKTMSAPVDWKKSKIEQKYFLNMQVACRKSWQGSALRWTTFPDNPNRFATFIGIFNTHVKSELSGGYPDHWGSWVFRDIFHLTLLMSSSRFSFWDKSSEGNDHDRIRR